MGQIKRQMGVAVLGLTCLGLTACSSLHAWTAPTWVYKNPQGTLELNQYTGGFCLKKPDATTCGTYTHNPDIFAAAMAHFNRPQGEVPKPDKPSDVKFTADGASWTWSVQPDGSFKDTKNEAWTLVEFRQLGRTHTE